MYENYNAYNVYYFVIWQQNTIFRQLSASKCHPCHSQTEPIDVSMSAIDESKSLKFLSSYYYLM